MSSRRSIAWLVFFVLLAVGAHVLISLRGGRMVATVRQDTLVPDADRATFVELTRPGAPTLAAVRDGNWRLTEPFAAAVNERVLRRLLDVLAFTRVSDVLTEAEMRRLGRKASDFGLDNPRLRIAVRQELHETVLAFGDATPAGDGVYVDLPKDLGVCVLPTNLFAAVDLTADGLRRHEILAAGGGRVVSIDVRRQSGKFVRANRADGESWELVEPQKAPASAPRVASLLKTLRETRASRFVWPQPGAAKEATPAVSLLAGYGLDAESAVTVTLKGEDGASRYVLFGKPADEGFVYALAQNGGAVVTVKSSLRDQILADADSLVDQRIFPFETAAVSTLSIADGDLVYLLARSPEGVWRIDSPVSAPADQEAVLSLLKGILSLRTTDRDPKGLLVSVSTNAPAVAVARDAILVQHTLEHLRAKTLLKLPSESIRRLTVTAADGAQESAVWDSANRTWLLAKPDGKSLNGLALAGVLGKLDPLTAHSIVKLRVAASEAGNYGLETPRFTIAIDPAAEGAVRRNVLIGSAAPGGGAYATIGSTDAVVILADEVVRALTQSFAASK